MMVTCLSQPEEVITGLEHGADDYVSKPFHPREVALRAQALIRRSAGNPGQHVVHVHRLRIDPARHLAHVAGQRIELGFTDFKLLAYLAAHRGTPQGWRVLLGEVWGAKDTAGGAGMVKAAVYRLRSRLAEADSDTDYILTLRGAGYLMPDLPPSGD
ncbi:MAG: winged helix-turn-helix domain-containing protein [Pseudonocardiaceae bacterium]